MIFYFEGLKKIWASPFGFFSKLVWAFLFTKFEIEYRIEKIKRDWRYRNE
jgi:hypothetical protein